MRVTISMMSFFWLMYYGLGSLSSHISHILSLTYLQGSLSLRAIGHVQCNIGTDRVRSLRSKRHRCACKSEQDGSSKHLVSLFRFYNGMSYYSYVLSTGQYLNNTRSIVVHMVKLRFGFSCFLITHVLACMEHGQKERANLPHLLQCLFKNVSVNA